jgi:DnaJ-class molecular chaperone
VLGTFKGHLDDEAKQALEVLGLHAFSTQCELRKAYLELMKTHHPDRFMNRPNQLEEAQNTAVRIRQAYDKISKQFCQAEC